jgi:hypothetical protein
LVARASSREELDEGRGLTDLLGAEAPEHEVAARVARSGRRTLIFESERIIGPLELLAQRRSVKEGRRLSAFEETSRAMNLCEHF